MNGVPRDLVVGIGEMALAVESGTVATHALGSCIGVALWEPGARIGGILHFLLPESTLNLDKARRMPCLFADTGLEHFLARAEALGANRRQLNVRLFGGATTLTQSTSDTGKRNYLAARKALWRRGILVSGEDVGGSFSRTIRLRVGDGTIELQKVEIRR